MTYAVQIFELSGAHFSPSISSMILAIVQIIGTIVAAYLVDRLGRKILMTTSLIGCTAGLSAMTVFLYLSDHGFDLHYFSWVPVTSLAVVILISNVGVIPLSMIYLTETMPLKVQTNRGSLLRPSFLSNAWMYSQVRGFAIAVGNSVLNVIAFGVAKMFPVLVEQTSLCSCMGIFAVNCAIGTFFVMAAIEETMGKDLEEDKEEDKGKQIP